MIKKPIQPKKNILILLATVLGLLLTSVGIGQVTETEQSLMKNNIYISTLHLFDVINPALIVGYERRFNNKLAIQFEGGPIIKRSMPVYFLTALYQDTTDGWWTYKGYKLRTELKIFNIRKNHNHKNTYLSIEFFATKNISHVNESFYVSDTLFDYSSVNISLGDERNYKDLYTIKRSRLGVTINYGFEENFTKNMTVNPSFGIGVVYQNIIEYNRANFDDRTSGGDSFFLKPGERFMPILTASLKIGIDW